MAVAASIKRRGTAGEMGLRAVDLTLDNSYPTGGWSVTPQQLGFGSNGTVWFVVLPEKDGFSFEWDYTSNKLMAFQNSAGNAPQAQVANASAALNAKVVRAVAYGWGQG